jgi:hypothetical protein
MLPHRTFLQITRERGSTGLFGFIEGWCLVEGCRHHALLPPPERQQWGEDAAIGARVPFTDASDLVRIV